MWAFAKTSICVGVCKTLVHNILQKLLIIRHNILQKLLIIRVVNFAKGTSRTGKKLWQSVATQK